MKNVVKLTIMCVLTMPAFARGADGPKLVGERVVMKPKEARSHARNLRLSPGGRHVLFLRQEYRQSKTVLPSPRTTSRPGNMLHVSAMVLRDLKTGKDKPVPVPPFADNIARPYMRNNRFDASGAKMAVMVGTDPKHNGGEGRNEMQLAIYDLATDKVRKLELKGTYILPMFTGGGKQIVAFVSDSKNNHQLYVTPVEKINLRKLSQSGWPLEPCPTADLLPIFLLPDRRATSRPSTSKFVLYDLKADKVRAQFKIGTRRQIPDLPLQWTLDGRYLYYLDQSPEGVGRGKPKIVTRIWDVRKAREAGIVDSATPIGPGPNGTMVMFAKGSRMLLHDPASGSLWYLAKALPLDARGKYVLYGSSVDTEMTVYVAEIVMPAKRKPSNANAGAKGDVK
jgi:hypothetical protein